MQIVINTPGTFLTQREECFRLKHRDNVLDISPLKLERIVITNQAMISTQALVLALEHNIDVIFLDKYGDPVGRVWFSRLGSTALIRRKQLEAATHELGIELAIQMVTRKMENQVRFLKKLMHARPGKSTLFGEFIARIEESRNALKANGNISPAYIMGLEGTAGRAYFQCISRILPEKYRFDDRSRRPARDPFNAVLNYCYGMLYGIVEKACILSGLDPYIGFLHADNYNKKSLVFDLIEPFRIFAEQTTVYLFTGKKMKDEYWDSKDGSVSLNKKGKPVVIEAMTKHLDERVRYRRRNVKRRHIIQHEAHRLANNLLADENVKRTEWLDIKEF